MASVVLQCDLDEAMFILKLNLVDYCSEIICIKSCTEMTIMPTSCISKKLGKEICMLPISI